MNILVLYCRFNLVDRRTIQDHLYSFKRYTKNARFLYVDMQHPENLTQGILRFPFDAVIFHYTFLAKRFESKSYKAYYQSIKDNLANLSGVKVMIPHDEYCYTDALWKIIKDCDISIVFASCAPKDYPVIFPEEQTQKKGLCQTVFTGYVEESLLKKIKKKNRSVDIGYRALRSNYIFGQHGQLKTQVAEEFLKMIPLFPSLNFNIKLNGNGSGNAIMGKRWVDFLASSRATIGCLGGSSLFDPYGVFREKTEDYVLAHPHAPYSEVEASCYPQADHKIAAYLLGPRHFECAMTKTCQLLVEGDYHGVLLPGKHYIEIKKDFSNISEILVQVQDTAYCEKIANQCFQDLVASEYYTYQKFALFVVGEISKLCCAKRVSFSLQWNIVHFGNFLKNLKITASFIFQNLLLHFRIKFPRLHSMVKKALGQKVQ